MHGIEVLLCEFVCALTLMIFMQIWLLADLGDMTFYHLGDFCRKEQDRSNANQGMGRPARPLVASSEMACPEIAACLLLLVHVAIGEGLQECDDRKLLTVVQSKISHLGCVDVVAHFWRQPSRAENVPRIVEVNDLLQRLEIAVVAVRLHELPGWPQVDIAQGWDLMLAPLSHVNRLRITRSLEEASEASIDPVITVRVICGLSVERVQRVPGHAQVIIGEVGEVRRHVTVGALRLATEKRKAPRLLDSQIGLSFQPIVVLGSELVDFCGSLIGRDRAAYALVTLGGVRIMLGGVRIMLGGVMIMLDGVRIALRGVRIGADLKE